MKFLIAGLGNIGAEYVETRHNIGFDVVSVLANKHRGTWRTDRLADVCDISIKGKKLVLIKPSTYMNLSGRAIKYWLDAEKIPIEHLLVVVDDLAFPLDAIKLKKSGSDAGHNGLKNIQEVLGTQQYPRLRFGIGNNFAKGRQVDFVLGRWLDQEMPLVNKKVAVACEMIECFCTIGIDRTMNLYNNTPVKP
ncbi:MAG: aminoacyl-tRNA hydrolase [Chitinophagaceae bacterium]|nr:aminoacyl-tRNA hydrolase [Chitinophagaceae bacterium]